MSTQTTFEDRLLDRLRLVVATNPVPPERGARRPRRSRWPLAAAGLAAAGVAAALAVLTVGETQAAYAIKSQPNGSVTVHIASLSDAAGLQAALRHRGIYAVVNYAAPCSGPPPSSVKLRPPPSSVKAPHSHIEQAPPWAFGTTATKQGVRVAVSKDANGTGGVTFKINPGDIPAGQKVYITTRGEMVNELAVGIGSKPPTLPCLPPPPR